MGTKSKSFILLQVERAAMEKTVTVNYGFHVEFVGIGPRCVSTHGGQPALFPAALAKKHFDVILTAYNFSLDPAMDGLIQSAKDAGVGIVAMKVMAGGFRQIKPGNPRYETHPY